MELQAAGVTLGVDYPLPIVDHDAGGGRSNATQVVKRIN
jgi:hypothetical protein